MFQRRSLVWAWIVSGCVASGWVMAQTPEPAGVAPSQARQALEVLLGSLADGEAVVPGSRPSAPAPVPVRQRVVVRSGETLDGVLRRTLSHLPIKESVLRAAFVDVNPDAFVSGSVHRLRAGAELWVPSPEDVRRIMLRDSGAPSPMARPAPSAPAAAAPVAGASAPATDAPVTDMRDWVRFP